MTPTNSPPADKRIIGSWTLTNGDYPLTYDFLPDGMAVPYMNGTKTKAYPYTFINGEVTFSVDQDNGRITKQSFKVTISGDTMSCIDDDAPKRVFKKDKRG